MASDDHKERRAAFIGFTVKWNLAIGLWLILSVFVLDYAGSATAPPVMAGLGVAIALVALLQGRAPLNSASFGWLTIVLGLVLILSPFMFGFSQAFWALYISLILGSVVTVMGLFAEEEALGIR